jgi:mxaJ protein
MGATASIFTTFRSMLLVSFAVLVGSHTPLRAADSVEPLRVCADPNNLPFSNARGEGLENKLAELLARALERPLEYTWWAQRRGFIRNTLARGRCDVVMGVLHGSDLALTTRPYYRSSYVFVQPRALTPPLRSLDDRRLPRLRLGVPLIGDDGTNAPPVHALARRGVIEHVIGYSMLGDYGEPNPPARLIEAVARGELDAAIAWGPLAGYFARRSQTPLRLVPVHPSHEDGRSYQFDVSLAVRRGDEARKQQLERVLFGHRRELAALLHDFGFPEVGAGG